MNSSQDKTRQDRTQLALREYEAQRRAEEWSRESERVSDEIRCASNSARRLLVTGPSEAQPFQVMIRVQLLDGRWSIVYDGNKNIRPYDDQGGVVQLNPSIAKRLHEAVEKFAPYAEKRLAFARGVAFAAKTLAALNESRGPDTGDYSEHQA